MPMPVPTCTADMTGSIPVPWHQCKGVGKDLAELRVQSRVLGSMLGWVVRDSSVLQDEMRFLSNAKH